MFTVKGGDPSGRTMIFACGTDEQAMEKTWELRRRGFRDVVVVDLKGKELPAAAFERSLEIDWDRGSAKGTQNQLDPQRTLIPSAHLEQNPHLYERDVEAVVNVILGRISDALVAGERVELRGFGAFTVKARAARAGRNPKTGKAVPVAERFVPAFKTGKGMQGRLNAPGVHAPAEIEATAGTAPVPRGARS